MRTSLKKMCGTIGLLVGMISPIDSGVPGGERFSQDHRGVWSGLSAYAKAQPGASLLRNMLLDLEIRDTLVYCLQGAWCGDSCASLMVLDIGDPVSPRFVSRLRFHGGAERGLDLKVLGDFVYVNAGTWDRSVFYVIDVSDPTTPSVAGSYSFPTGAFGLDVVDTVAVVTGGVDSVGSGYYNYRTSILSISDPANITEIGSVLTDNILDHVRVRGNYAYGLGGISVYVIDLSDPTQARLVSQFASDSSYVPYNLDFGESDSLLFVAANAPIFPFEASAFSIYNISDPENPSLFGRYPLDRTAHDVKVHGDWAFFSNGSCGLQVFDVSHPTAPDSVSRYGVPEWAGHMASQDSLLLIADIGPYVFTEFGGYPCWPAPVPNGPQPGDLLILNIADPINPTLLGFYHPTEQDPTDVGEPDLPQTLPNAFALYPNYPNPFNPGTTVEFDLPRRCEVRLTVYNLLGQEVASRAATLSAGRHTMQVDMPAHASGVYFYELRAGEYTGSGKMLLLK